MRLFREVVLLTELSATEAEYDGGLDRSEVEAAGGRHRTNLTHTHLGQWLTSLPSQRSKVLGDKLGIVNSLYNETLSS